MRLLASSRWFEVAMLVALVVVVAVITWFRVPAEHHDRAWAEDASEFMKNAAERGPLQSLFTGYSGYQHFIPRVVVALIWPWVDLADFAVVVFVACSVLTGLVAAAVFWLSRDLLPWMPARIALGLITGILPLATQETVGNLADFHVYAMWLMPWLLLHVPRRWWSGALWGLVAFAGVMTEVQSIFFVFLIVFRLRRRHRRAWPVFVGFLAGAAGQLITVATVPRPTGTGLLSIPSTVIGWMVNTVLPLVTADPEMIRAYLLHKGLLVPILILVPILVAAVVAVRFGSGDQRLLVITLLLGSAAVFTGSAWANSDTGFMYAEQGLRAIEGLHVNSRYGVSSGMLLAAVVPVAAGIVVQRWGSRVPVVSRAIATVAVVGIVAILAHGSTMTYSARDSQNWSATVHDAVAKCQDLPADRRVDLSVAPERETNLRCSDILRLTRH